MGVLVQANFGLRHQLRIAGLPVGRELREGLVYSKDTGSIIIVVATDAPLLPHQLKRLARRAALGLARTGQRGRQRLGRPLRGLLHRQPQRAAKAGHVRPLQMLPNDRMGPLFEATVGATEEAIVNALVAGRTMRGHEGHEVLGLPHEKVREILRRHGLPRPLDPQDQPAAARVARGQTRARTPRCPRGRPRVSGARPRAEVHARRRPIAWSALRITSAAPARPTSRA